MKCPVCKGKGCLPPPRSSDRDLSKERTAMAKTLRNAGYSYRQIGKFLGLKSPRSVQLALNR